MILEGTFVFYLVVVLSSSATVCLSFLCQLSVIVWCMLYKAMFSTIGYIK